MTMYNWNLETDEFTEIPTDNDLVAEAATEDIEPDVIGLAKVTNIVAPANINPEDQCYWRKRMAELAPTSNVCIIIPKQ